MEYHCGICDLAIESVDVMVHCHETCGKHFHVSCTDLTPNALLGLKECAGLKWSCEPCRGMGIGTVLESMHVLQGDFEKTSSQVGMQLMGMNMKLARMAMSSGQNDISGTPRTNKRPRYSPSARRPSIATYAATVVCGGEEATELTVAAPPVSKKYLYVSNLHRDTEPEGLINFVTSKTTLETKDAVCFKLVKRGTDISNYNFVSFKFGVPESYFDTINNHNFWPKGIRIKEFLENRPLDLPYLPRRTNIGPYNADCETPGLSNTQTE